MRTILDGRGQRMTILKWLIIIVIAIPLLITACVAPASAPQVRPTAKEAYEMALNHATAKYEDVYLLYLSGLRVSYVTIYSGQPSYLAEGRSDDWKITFAKPTGPQEYIKIFTTVKSGEITQTLESDPLSLSSLTWEEQLPYLTVDTQNWNIDSPEAVRIAMEVSGDGLSLLMLALINDVKYPKWRIVFAPPPGEKGGYSELKVEINATNGEVINSP